ncbi:MAG: hypothetical protein AB7C95_00650 [Synergistaceae bacterium]
MDKLIRDVCLSLGKEIEDEEEFCADCADKDATYEAECEIHREVVEEMERTLYTKREVAAILLDALCVATEGSKLRGTARNKLLLRLERDLPDKDRINV